MASRFTSATWWKGALTSAFKETLRGLAVGFFAAAVLCGVGHLGLAVVLPMVEVGGSFSPALLMAICGVISGVTGLFTGGSQALAQEKQQQTTAREEAKLRELDGRTQSLEQQVTRSPRMQQILERGPRHAANVEATTKGVR